MQNILRKNLFNQRGVTLIELIAVILILGIIAAVGIPVVFNQIEKANIAADAANVAIINDAIERYALLNEGYPKVASLDLLKTALTTPDGTTVKGGPFVKTDFAFVAKQKGKTMSIIGDATTGVSGVEVK